MADYLGDGRQDRLLNMLDDFKREGTVIQVALFLPADPVIRLRSPGSSGHGLRFDPATHSNLIRPPIPGHPATLFG